VKQIELHPEAEAEMRVAARWYHACQPGLGARFLREVAQTGKRIASHPEVWPVVAGAIRCCQVEHFPFGLLYRSDTNRIYVLAVMHHKRKPGYWKNRVA